MHGTKSKFSINGFLSESSEMHIFSTKESTVDLMDGVITDIAMTKFGELGLKRFSEPSISLA